MAKPKSELRNLVAESYAEVKKRRGFYTLSQAEQTKLKEELAVEIRSVELPYWSEQERPAKGTTPEQRASIAKEAEMGLAAEFERVRRSLESYNLRNTGGDCFKGFSEIIPVVPKSLTSRAAPRGSLLEFVATQLGLLQKFATWHGSCRECIVHGPADCPHLKVAEACRKAIVDQLMSFLETFDAG